MKFLPTTLLTGLLALTLHAKTPPKTGDAPAKNPPEAAAKAKTGWRNGFLVFEVYALDKNDARGVIEGDGGSAARYHRTTELAKAGKARLETLTALPTKSGQRAMVQGIDEVRYPTEFNPPDDEKSIAEPTAWETRNAGDTLEIEPVLSDDGRTCDVNLVPQRVSLTGLRDTPGGTGDAPTSQPIFDCQKLTTSATARIGEPLFLGTYTPPPGKLEEARADEMWLAFLRVDLQSPNESDVPSAPKSNPSRLVHVEYSIYSLDRALARDLFATPEPLGAAWEKLQKFLEEKKATFEHLTTVTTNSGMRTVAGEVREERYWTEARPASRAGPVESTRRTTVTGETADPAQPGKRDPSKSTTTTETTTVTREDANSPRIPAYRTAFESRETGIYVEVEPVISPDGRSVDLNQVVNQTTLLGKLKATGVAEKYPWQPLFETRKLTNSQTLPIGVHVLGGTLNPPGADGVNGRTDTGRTWVLFIRAMSNEP